MVTEALKILAIDDSPDNLNVLKVVVRDALPGTAVVTALNGPQGLALARSEDPDVILLDIMMPEMDGYAVCRALKADDRLRQIPVVFLTALRADRESRLQALEAGAEAFLAKPLDEVELIAQIRAMAKIKAANQMQRLEREQLAELVIKRTRELERELAERGQVEAALRESEDKFKYVFDNSVVGKSITFLSGEINVNKAFGDMLGYTPEELQSQKWQDISHPDDIELSQRAVQALLAGEKESQRFIKRYLHKDGAVVWADVSTSLRRDKEGKPLYFITTSNNITERKRTEEALRVAEERYRRLFEEAPLMDVVTRSQAGVPIITDCNQAFLSALGYNRDAVVGRSLVDFYTSESRAALLNNGGYLRALEGQFVSEERALVARDGRVIQTMLTTVPESDTEGNVIGTRAMYIDITERERAETALRLSEEKYRTLVDEVNDGFYVSDGAGVFTFANPALARMYGVESPAALVGRKFSDFLASEMPAVLGEAYGSTMQTGRAPEVIKGQILRPDGIRAFIEIKPTMIVEGDQIVGTRGVVRDITARREAEETLRATLADLQRSNADLERFAYVASHDLQEPLRMVASYVQLLGMNYRGRLDADADEFIGYAVEGAKRMQQVILDLLEYSRAGTHGTPLQPTDANRACQAALQNLELAIVAHDATVVCDPLPTVLADDMQLAQLFQNLIANAIKFRGAAPPQVHISARQTSKVAAKVWEFAVHDNGIGIDPAYFERIFVIFQRLHTREAYAGTGIGLAICKKIVERHGGRIWVESQVGQGATFYFTLPAAT